MAVFGPVFDWVMKWEGKVLEEVAGDAGGMTFWGISRNNNPSWPGWPLVDAHIQAADDFKAAGELCDQDDSLTTLVSCFYAAMWNRMGLEGLNYQELALQVYDKTVNMGGIAVKAFQAIIGAPVDGVIGPNTLLRANSSPDPSGLVDRFLGWAQAHYEDIVTRHPEDEKFLKGWKNRCVRSDGK